CVDDRREVGTADAAQRADREAAAGHLGRAELLLARLLRDLAEVARKVEQALLVAIPDHRHHQAVGRVHRDADVEVLLQDQLLARLVERGVELRKLFQRRDHRLDLEHQRADLQILVLGAELLAERLHLGDVGVLVLGDVGDHRPVARQVRAGDLLDARQRLLLNLAELGEVDLRPRQQVQAAHRGGGTGRRTRARGERVLDVGADVVALDAATAATALHLANVHPQFARKCAHRRAGVGRVARHHHRGIQRPARVRDVALRYVARFDALAGYRGGGWFGGGGGGGGWGRRLVGDIRRLRTLTPALSRGGRGGRRDGFAVGFLMAVDFH